MGKKIEKQSRREVNKKKRTKKNKKRTKKDKDERGKEAEGFFPRDCPCQNNIKGPGKEKQKDIAKRL